jgi:hypothetical protein
LIGPGGEYGELRDTVYGVRGATAVSDQAQISFDRFDIVQHATTPLKKSGAVKCAP